LGKKLVDDGLDSQCLRVTDFPITAETAESVKRIISNFM